MNKEQLLQSWINMNVDERLLLAFAAIPREKFVAPELRLQAYHDHPLPTLRKQSISQPSTVMMMLQALQLRPKDKVFELGTGAGYQASLLAKITGPEGKVISIEVMPELVALARQNHAEIGIQNVVVMEGDGAKGYPPEAPYDRIIITAACPTIPEPLIQQLKEGGIVIAPVGDLKSQTLVKGTKQQGKLELEFLGQFVFVPMKGKYGFKEVEMYYE